MRSLRTGRAENSYTYATSGTVSRHLDRLPDLHLALLGALTGAQERESEPPESVLGPQLESLFDPDPEPVFGPMLEPVFGPKPEP